MIRMSRVYFECHKDFYDFSHYFFVFFFCWNWKRHFEEIKILSLFVDNFRIVSKFFFWKFHLGLKVIFGIWSLNLNDFQNFIQNIHFLHSKFDNLEFDKNNFWCIWFIKSKNWAHLRNQFQILRNSNIFKPKRT